jgi:replicative DNA helicase
MATAPVPANDYEDDPLANLQLEQSLLGLLMADNSHVDRAADVLAPADFSDHEAQHIYETILHLVSQGKPANPATMRGLVSNPGLLIALTANPMVWMTPADAAKQLAELGQRRRMRDGLINAAQTCDDLTAPASEVVTLADAAIAPKAQGSMREASIAKCLGDYIDGLDHEQHGVLCQSIPSFDELHGPMEPSQLIILAGRPGMGKTALALSYTLGAAQAGHGVLFVSLEMNTQQLSGRMFADLCFDGAEIPYNAIRDRKLNDFQRRRLAEVQSKAHSLPLRIIDAGSMTPGRLGMIARRTDRRMRAKGQKLDLIVVDYLQLMRPDSGANKPYEAVSEVSKALKALAKDAGVPILALAQLSREVERRAGCRPQLADLRDSGQIEQDADSVMFLLREEYYLRQDQPEPTSPDFAKWQLALSEVSGKIEFILAKRRNGTTGKATGSFHGAYQAVR